MSSRPNYYILHFPPNAIFVGLPGLPLSGLCITHFNNVDNYLNSGTNIQVAHEQIDSQVSFFIPQSAEIQLPACRVSPAEQVDRSDIYSARNEEQEDLQLRLREEVRVRGQGKSDPFPRRLPEPRQHVQV